MKGKSGNLRFLAEIARSRNGVRETGASAAGRGQRPYASFPDLGQSPKNPPFLKKG